VRVAFRVDAYPIAQPRQRVCLDGPGKGTYIPRKHPIWNYKHEIQLRARQALAGCNWSLDRAVYCTILFVFPGNCHRRTWHFNRPDADNLAKAVLDALNGVAWVDDGQVAVVQAIKLRGASGEKPHVLVTLRYLPAGESEEVPTDGG
jgi:Holliday junction resolvase RusA-like endonuclease